MTTGSSEHLPKQDPGDLPFQNRSFLFFLATQALGAFNDNVFKQLVLLLGVGYLMLGIEYQALVQFLFAVPFLLFSGIAGDLSDRFSKGRLMTVFKIAEIVIALAGVGAFLFTAPGSPDSVEAPFYLWLLALVCFALGTHSAFFGPPKYGGIPELVNDGDLAPATGLTQMTTFLAIIFGVALAGLLADLFADRIYVVGLVTVSIAVMGTLTSYGITRHPAAAPARRITFASLTSVIPTIMDIIRRDALMLRIMIAYSWFWFVGGITLTAINAFGRLQLGLNNFETSLMVAMTSIGIAAGSVVVGRLSRGRIRLGFIVPGLVLLVLCLTFLYFLPVHHPSSGEIEVLNELKNAPATLQNAIQIIPKADTGVRCISFLILFLLGTASGFFSVPLLAFIQARPPASDKGKVFAAVNWLNWIFIVGSAIVYGIGISLIDYRANVLLALLGVITGLIGLVLLPGIFLRVRNETSGFVATAQDP
ncbi:MAG: MFS transporter [Methylococcales bacterium]